MKLFYFCGIGFLAVSSALSMYLVSSNSLISYADDEKVNIREDSIRSRGTTFFYSTSRRTPSGGGFGFGK